MNLELLKAGRDGRDEPKYPEGMTCVCAVTMSTGFYGAQASPAITWLTALRS